MANKTATLKNQAGDNIYPNIVGDNRNAAIKDSTTIKHTLTKNKISLDLDEAVKGKIDAALQKPTGLTKTKLVGVGASGQENIEIGDNLTLANGKLSATGGGSGEMNVCIIKVSRRDFSYTSNIPLPTDGSTPVFVDIPGAYNCIYPLGYAYETDEQGSHYVSLMSIDNGDFYYGRLKSDGTFTIDNIIDITKYYHFITITSSTSTFYFTYQNTSNRKLNTFDSLKTALAGKHLLCTGHTDSETAEYISGEGGNLVVGVVDKSDNTTSGITIDSSFTITDLVSPVK